MSRHKHPFHSIYLRAFYSVSGVLLIMLFGVLGVHYFEKLSYLDSFYLMSMIATAQGPNYTPVTAQGKIFIAFMAFVSVGAGVTSLGFLFGPFLGQVWRLGAIKVEEDLHLIKKEEHQEGSSKGE